MVSQIRMCHILQNIIDSAKHYCQIVASFASAVFCSDKRLFIANHVTKLLPVNLIKCQMHQVFSFSISQIFQSYVAAVPFFKHQCFWHQTVNKDRIFKNNQISHIQHLICLFCFQRNIGFQCFSNFHSFSIYNLHCPSFLKIWLNFYFETKTSSSSETAFE